jgi:hypothetical protein
VQITMYLFKKVYFKFLWDLKYVFESNGYFGFYGYALLSPLNRMSAMLVTESSYYAVIGIWSL